MLNRAVTIYENLMTDMDDIKASVTCLPHIGKVVTLSIENRNSSEETLVQLNNYV